MPHYRIAQENTSPEFITLQAAKAHLRVDHTYEDEFIASLIQAAITAAEDYTGIFLRHHAIDILTGGFPQCLTLEYGPLRNENIVISYYDPDNASQSYGSNNYEVVRGYGKKPQLRFTGEDPAPQVYNRYNAVTFSLSGGFESELPAPVYQAALLIIGDFYQYREDRRAIINTRAMSLLRPYKKWT